MCPYCFLLPLGKNSSFIRAPAFQLLGISAYLVFGIFKMFSDKDLKAENKSSKSVHEKEYLCLDPQKSL